MKELLLIFLLPISLFAQTAIYRSVQPGVTAAIGTGTGTLTISGSTATFSVSQPDSVGVGDAIQYDSDGNGSIDAICFIHGRTSGTEYTVKNAAGAAPTAVAGDEDWDIFRAYTSLSNWESGTENTGINASVRAFDGGDRNIDSANEVWYVACYPGIDATQVTVSGWTTSASDRIIIYAPTSSSEVGRNMRHSGVWTTDKYRMIPSASSASAILINPGTGNVEVIGLQIHMQANGSAEAAISNLAIGTVVIVVNKCIIRGNTTQSSATRFYGVRQAGGGNVVVKNSILYDFSSPSTSSDGAINYEGGVGVLYNNTIVDNNLGANVASGSVWANGNVAQNNANGYNGTFQAGTSHNLSDLASDAPGTDALNEVDLSFRNYASDDFHLAENDVALVGAGLDISTYDTVPAHTLSDDIDGDARVDWNRGADEFQGSTQNYYRRRLDQ